MPHSQVHSLGILRSEQYRIHALERRAAWIQRWVRSGDPAQAVFDEIFINTRTGLSFCKVDSAPVVGVQT